MTHAPRAAYVHIPFCVSKCHYCDFDSFPGMEPIFDEYLRALVREIEATPAHAYPLSTVYFGGGTPTVLSSGQLAEALHAIERRFGLASDAEVTVEANPGTVDESKFAKLREAGFNRLSVGVQSFDDDFLSKIGRAHNARDAVEAYRAARRAGFANIGIDLIFALPGQSVSHWETTLDTAIGLDPEHVSLYELSIEQGTRFAELCAEGRLALPDEDTQLDMYELAIAKLTSRGYEHYEVSNFARPGFRSRHNQVYWRNEPFLGFGAGAASYVGGIRAHRVSDPRSYIDAVLSSSNAIDFSEELAGRAALAESLMLGLRMLEGIDLHKLSEQTCTDALAEFGPQIESLVARGLVELAGARLRVTHRGLLLLNDVSQEFM
jgi:oxygen-independent coproporphyrinogen-3 oxidase